MLLLLLSGTLIFVCLYIKTENIAKTIIYTHICFSGITFLSSATLSQIRAFNKIGISLVWGVVSICCILIIKKNQGLWKERIKKIRELGKGTGMYEKTVAFFLIVIFITALIRGIGYPPQNVDSLVYHLPRAFYYYKENAVINIPASYAWTNYTAPANAIFMSQLLALCDGNDLFVNLIQLPSLVVCAASCYLICDYVKLERKMCWLAAAATCLPLVVLQAATTQNDLLAAGYCVATIAVMVMIFTEKKWGLRYAFLLGVTGGCAVYAKILSGLALFFPVILFSCFEFKQFKLKASIPLGITTLTGILINFPYWMRNFFDLHGDFLALGVSSSLSGNILELGKRNCLGRAVLNLGYTMGGRDTLVCKWWSDVCKNVYSLLGSSECQDIINFGAGNPGENHDGQPFGIVVWLAFVMFILSIIFWKKLAKFTNLYVICSFLMMAISSMALTTKETAIITSAPRYLLAGMLICIPGVCMALYEMKRWKLCKKNRLFHGGVIIITFMIMINGMHAGLFDEAQPILGRGKQLFRWEEARDYRYFDQGWNSSKKEYMEKINERGLTRIGIWEKNLSGVYPMLNMLKASKYQVKSIYGLYAMEHLDKEFEPEAIIYIGENGAAPEKLEFAGKVYAKASEEDALRWNNAASCLYIEDTLTNLNIKKQAIICKELE